MAQREKEETEFKVPEGFKLCVNNCGFSGNPATNNMCQKCYKAAGFLTLSSFPAISVPESQLSATIRLPKRSDDGSSAAAAGAACDSDDSFRKPVEQSQVRQVNRCSCCRKRVGLTGFRCRCGDLFCGEHRYSDKHDCSFDYRSAGKEAIARENPLVKASKIIRI